MPKTLRLHFRTFRSLDGTMTREYQLLGDRGQDVISRWPMSQYSREKALGRADRLVGEICRRADQDGIVVFYSQEIPVG